MLLQTVPDSLTKLAQLGDTTHFEPSGDQPQMEHKRVPYQSRSFDECITNVVTPTGKKPILKAMMTALVKGIGNYVCLDRLGTEQAEGSLDAQQREWQRLIETMNDHARAFERDFETLGFQLSGELRSRICGDSDQCAWKKCPSIRDCYIRQMREKAQRAQVIVVNHTLLLLDAVAEGAILPNDIPEPSYGNNQAAQDYMIALAQRMYQLVMISRGRAFLLFASKHMLDQVYREISAHIPYPILRQGDLPRAELVNRFKAARNAVLFGVKTFWEGVDIPGEALSLVVIDRLPFEPPDDPVHEARVRRMKAQGENWFRDYVLPEAVLNLKQGVGRLLRTD